MSDEGVSELLGYAVLAGMVITAVICIASGAGGAITSAAENAGFSEAALAIRTFAATASDVAHVNNTYFTAAEVRIPAGYKLIALDGLDDIACFAVSCGNREIFAMREGGIRLQSPFRSAIYEGGAVFGNDSGMITVIRKPSVFTVGHVDGRSLYIFITAISVDPMVIADGGAVVLDVRASARQNVSQPADSPVTISVSSACPEGWSAVFRDAGFSVEQEGGTVTAIIGGITDVCIDCATLQVRIE
jgi:hypothetical protein